MTFRAQIHGEDEYRIGEALAAFFAQSADTNMRVKAVSALVPLLDSGIDVMAVEGAVKDPKFATLEAQNDIREQMMDGVISAFHVLGISRDEIDAALKIVAKSGITTRHVSEQIADRLATWDRLTFANMFYGPDLAGRMLTRDDGQA